MAALIGGWSPIAFILAGAASMLVALCFAEVGSRFEGTGGPYLYVQAAFGRFTAFEVGWMQWFTRATSWASIVNGTALALGFYWPAATGGMGRSLAITGITIALTWINIRGIRQSSWVINALTISTLAPLGLFILVGIWFIDPARIVPVETVTVEQASMAALLLIFVYGGYDVVSVPAGESRNPRRDLPFAFILTIIAATLVMTLAQVVAQGVLPNLGASKTPLADASLLLMGGVGALIMGIGSVVSMTGNNAGQALTGSRMLYALAEHRQLPAFLGRVHPVYRTPVNAILFTSVVALTLALSGSFVMLAAVSAVARLITYTGACAATLVLRRPRFTESVMPATFVVPGGALVPVLAIAVSLAILAGASREQLIGGVLALVAGAVLYVVNDRQRRGSTGSPNQDSEAGA